MQREARSLHIAPSSVPRYGLLWRAHTKQALILALGMVVKSHWRVISLPQTPYQTLQSHLHKQLPVRHYDKRFLPSLQLRGASIYSLWNTL